VQIGRAFLYSLALFGGLVVIAMLTAGIMKLIYSCVHRSEKKISGETNHESPQAENAGKANQT
jgi:hypothetical protein